MMSRDIFDACEKGDIPGLLSFIQSDERSINTFNRYGFTPLSKACYSGNADCAEVLIQAGANVNAGNDIGTTALHYAAIGFKGKISGKSSECLEFLLKNGAHINAKDMLGDTPLHYAANFGSVVTMGALLDHGAGFSILNKDQLPFWELIKGIYLRKHMKSILDTYEFPMKEPVS